MDTSSGSDDVHHRRQARLRQLMDQRGLSAIVVTKPVNIFYLTGFRGSAGIVVMGFAKSVLWVDPRYTLQASEQVRGVRVVEERGVLLNAVGRWLQKKRSGPVAYEDASLTCRDLGLLRQEAAGAVRLKPAGDLVEELRALKGPEEIAEIRKAGRVTAEALEEVIPLVRPGVRESELAGEIEYRMRRKGAEGAAFETIVASGARAALPHARASDKPLQSNELVIFDLGAILGGYAADMTRTIYLGKPPRRVRSLYAAVREAQREAVELLRSGIRAGEVDRVARRALARRHLAKYFTHTTGHGVGLEVHERPRLARGERTPLANGSVVTAEPGIYLKGLGGIRLEDTVLVTAGEPEILTPASKDSWVLN